jgi:hypothetical protein
MAVGKRRCHCPNALRQSSLCCRKRIQTVHIHDDFRYDQLVQSAMHDCAEVALFKTTETMTNCDDEPEQPLFASRKLFEDQRSYLDGTRHFRIIPE